MYHEKIGIIYDNLGNKIAFTGSMNETINAFHNNYESIVVFNSLMMEDHQRVEDLERDFDCLWAGREANIEVLEFPTALKKRLLAYRKPDINLSLDYAELELSRDALPIAPGIPKVPQGVSLHDYQNEAIENWAHNKYALPRITYR